MSEPIHALIDRGIALHAQIKALKDELKAISDQIEAIALEGEQVALEDPDRPGKQYLAKATDGTIVPVVFESDQIIGSMPVDSEQAAGIIAAVKEIAADPEDSAAVAASFARFYRLKYDRVFEDAQRFRREARGIFGDENGTKFIHACLSLGKDGIPKSRTVIDWNRAKPAPAE